jgi:SAM-dependent methyltransferase
LAADRDSVRCERCHTVFPLAAGRPVLICPDNPVFDSMSYGAARPRVSADRRLRSRVAERALRSVNLSRDRCLADMAGRLDPGNVVLLLGSGDQKQHVQHLLGAPITVIAIDVDPEADVDAFVDGHALPFKDGAFDAVVTTAVLEHVLRPERVMSEIARVVRSEGLLYSEIPFMQQVHAGAYDFTRYTLSGHRRLAAPFAELESGAVAGPGTALLWSIEHWLLALGASRRATKAMRVALGWLGWLDRRIAERPAALDGASCTYYYGRRRRQEETSDRWIVEAYRGAQRAPVS